MLLRTSARKRRYLFAKPKRSKARFVPWLLPLLVVSLMYGYKQVEGYFVQPQGIVVLGGDPARESFAAELARQHPELPIWVSSGSPEGYSRRLFTKAGIAEHRVHLRYDAVDTVTNFTTLVEPLQAEGIDSVYLLTSDDHMGRARVIGEIVFGSRGILLKPIVVPSGRSPEPLEKAFRDGARAVLWVTTGHTGATLKGIKPD